MKTDLEVEVEVDLRPLGKVIIFRVKQNLPIINRCLPQICLLVRNSQVGISEGNRMKYACMLLVVVTRPVV